MSPSDSSSEATTGRTAIGQRLRDLRISREWTQGTLAKQVGVSIPSISAYERGTRAISLDELTVLCAAFDLLVVEFLAGLHPYGTRTAPDRTTSAPRATN